jgi:glyoxylase-like metal-dependent hydrolase (beta-lactamase superfamily II)
LSAEVHHFKVGSFECIAVSDGTFTYAPPQFPKPAATFFSNAPEKQLKRTLLQHNIQPERWTEHITPYICLLVNTGNHRVLVDTGADGLGPDTGRLLLNLKTEGIAPESIDIVILTHCHPDHIGGITLDNGALTFPNARYVLWKNEWDFWTSEGTEGKTDKHISEVLFSIAHKKLLPIQHRIDLIEHEGEILPGIRAIAAPGHTPGHMAIAIVSEGEQVLCISDTVLHPIHVEHPEWYAVVDFDPEQLKSTRRRILGRAAVEKALVLAFHFPFPGLGYIVRKEDGWQWQPIYK